MKKIIIALFLIVLCGACGYKPPVLNDNTNPLIVDKIVIVNSEFAMYYSLRGRSYIERAAIILPVGWFNVGDTIKFKR